VGAFLLCSLDKNLPISCGLNIVPTQLMCCRVPYSMLQNLPGSSSDIRGACFWTRKAASIPATNTMRYMVVGACDVLLVVCEIEGGTAVCRPPLKRMLCFTRPIMTLRALSAAFDLCNDVSVAAAGFPQWG
jgi:hypothetical protein